jgi:enoyl-CoA hydratase
VNAFKTIIYEKQAEVGYITLNRPQVLNVYNMQMRDELYQVLAAIRDDPEVRAVIISGAGERAFCAGADLTEFLSAPSPTIARQVRWERDVWGLFLSVPQPLIAAMHGYVLGDGLEIALCCDIRIASEDAQFGAPETGLGIIPAAGGSQLLPRTINRSPAMELLLTGRIIGAEEAYRLKLVNRVVPRDELLSTAQQLADRIKANNQLALNYAKKAVTQGLELDLTDGLELEARLAVMLLASLANRK